jgi:DNA-binding GntR family transcriptional regulator
MEPIDSTSFRPLYDTVYAALRQRISDGTLRAGETVTEADLASSLSVSRTPVRDAVRRLVAENLLVMPKKGAVRVYSPTAADLADVYCTRATLEGMAARLAGMRSNDVFVNELNGICDRCAQLSKDDLMAAAALNGEFHQTILHRADNGRIEHLLANLNPVIVRYRHISLTFREHLTQSWEEHRTIAQLFAECSPDTVETHVRLHILKAGGRIVAAMRALEGPSASSPSMDLVLNA